jgi:hypothetical protein
VGITANSSGLGQRRIELVVEGITLEDWVDNHDASTHFSHLKTSVRIETSETTFLHYELPEVSGSERRECLPHSPGSL